MLPTIMSISEFLAQHKQSFFIYKGISYEIDELYQDDDGKYFVHGVSNDGEEATEEVFMPLSQGTEDKSARTAIKQ
jgi:hypothetical protein